MSHPSSPKKRKTRTRAQQQHHRDNGDNHENENEMHPEFGESQGQQQQQDPQPLISESDTDIDYYSYASATIHKDYLHDLQNAQTFARQEKSRDPMRDEFDERVIERDFWLEQEMEWTDWVIMDTTPGVRTIKENYVPRELSQYDMDYAHTSLRPHHQKFQSPYLQQFSRSKAQQQYLHSSPTASPTISPDSSSSSDESAQTQTQTQTQTQSSGGKPVKFTSIEGLSANLDAQQQPQTITTTYDAASAVHVLGRRRGRIGGGDDEDDADYIANEEDFGDDKENRSDEKISIEDIGDPIQYIHSQVDQHNARYAEWRKYVNNNENHNRVGGGIGRGPGHMGQDNYDTWNNAFDGDTSEHGAYGNRWWNTAGSNYDMPHQALHGGVSAFDDEADMPLNSYWHKSTMSPETWSILKSRFRENMRPGSSVWNEVAFTSDWHRRSIEDGWWPKSLQTWFLKNEEEMIHCHDFRCKMMDHSALNEYWRLGELRWNRKQWLPYVRLGQMVVAPIVAMIGYYRYVSQQGHPSFKRLEENYQRWKYCAKTGDWDEYYMFGMTASHGVRAPPIAKKPPTIEYMESVRARTIQKQFSKITGGGASPSDPY